MREIQLSEHIEIDRPAAEAWAVVADYRRDPEWRTGVVTMAPEPVDLVAVGTTTAEELRMARRTWHNDGVVTAVEPGVRFAWRTTEGADASGSREVEGLGRDRCRVRLTMVVRPHGPERLLRPVLARMLRTNLRGDLERLRTLVRTAAASPAAAP